MSSATTLLEQFTDADVDWMLNATEERHVAAGEMDRLDRASAVRRDCTNIRFEDQGTNLFAECVKG